jgi:hypothetical protein
VGSALILNAILAALHLRCMFPESECLSFLIYPYPPMLKMRMPFARSPRSQLTLLGLGVEIACLGTVRLFAVASKALKQESEAYAHAIQAMDAPEVMASSMQNYKPIAKAKREDLIKNAFPRWGDPEGIDLDGMLLTFNRSILARHAKFDVLHPNESFAAPLTQCIFGNVSTSAYQSDKPYAWTSTSAVRARTLFGFRFAPLDRLLVDSLEVLVNDASGKWSRLREVALSSGVPFIFNCLAYRLCSKSNLQANGIVYNVPVFSLCSAHYSKNCNFSFPLPTYAVIANSKNQSRDWAPIFQEQNQKYPWENKTSLAIWRGSGTGFGGKRSSRYRFMSEAIKHPNLLDVGCTCMTAKLPNRCGVLVGKKGKIPFDDFQKYLAIADIDGNSWSERFGRLLCLNSVVLKVEPEFTDYFMPELEPWVHCVPIHLNSTDLYNVTECVMANRDQMKKIMENARLWCRKRMVYQELKEHVLSTLSFYVAQLDKKHSLGRGLESKTRDLRVSKT